MTNFSFLQTKNEYVMFASAAMEAEKVYGAAPPCAPSAAEKRWSWR